VQINGQLQLFTEKKTPELDNLVFDLNSYVGSYKHFAYLIEGSIGKNHCFNLVLEGAKVLDQIVEALKPLSIKYQNRPTKEWKIKSEYDPYYSPLEPRSIFNLSDIGLDYKSRSNGLLLRNKAILALSSAKAVRLCEEFVENNERIIQEFKNLTFLSTPYPSHAKPKL